VPKPAPQERLYHKDVEAHVRVNPVLPHHIQKELEELANDAPSSKPADNVSLSQPIPKNSATPLLSLERSSVAAEDRSTVEGYPETQDAASTAVMGDRQQPPFISKAEDCAGSAFMADMQHQTTRYV
jgi:hypothetical protein